MTSASTIDPEAIDAESLTATSDSRLIEVGWLVVGALDEVDRKAVVAARDRTLEGMRDAFPNFEWRMPLLERRDLAQEVREEPVTLLDYGRGERDARRWDFALVVTGADLVAHEKPYALAVPSRALGVGVLSTVRIDPQASGAPRTPQARRGARRRAAAHEVPPPLPDGERAEVMAKRMVSLALHLLGHLNGLDHSDKSSGVMHQPAGVGDLDSVTGFLPEQAEELAEELADVADLRLEERRRRLAPLAFYLQVAWLNRDDIASSVRLARPWMFPLQLSRLTTAAGSALVILLLTAETWDLGMSQPGGLVAALAGLVMVSTTAYVLKHQRLLVSRGSGRLTEQTVVTNISLTLTVVLGLGVTFAGLFLVALGAEHFLYPPSLVAAWAASNPGPVTLNHYLVLAGFVASLGMVIGTLGASFEEENYIRHIAFVDEET